MKSDVHTIEGKKLALSSVHGKVKNKGKVTEAFGFRAVESGLEPYIVLPSPEFDNTPFTTFPDPQVFQGRLHTLLISRDLPYVLEGNNLTLLSLGGEANQAGNSELSSNGMYSYVDLGDYFVAVNGSITLYGSFLTNTFYIASPSISCCGTYKGRTVYAGFDSSNTFNHDWKDFFSQDAESINVEGLRRNYIMLCPVDTDPFWLFNPPEEKVRDLLKNNEIMFAPIPEDSQIIGVGGLNDELFVYTNKSIYSANLIQSPTIAFSKIVP